MNNSLQLQHFFLLIPAIGNRPPEYQCYGRKGCLSFRNKMGEENRRVLKFNLREENTNDNKTFLNRPV